MEWTTAPATEDRPPDAWTARRWVVQPHGSRAGRSGRIVRQTAIASGLIPATGLHCPAGGDLLVSEPSTADQEHLQDGFPHWGRLGRVLPVGLPRPGLHGGPAQRGPARGDGFLNWTQTTERANASTWRPIHSRSPRFIGVHPTDRQGHPERPLNQT